MKYRKKPIVIDAFLWTADQYQGGEPDWIVDAIKRGEVWFHNEGTEDVKMEIKTLEGNHIADRGDFIIRGVAGEIYPCKPDIFKQTYELASTPQVALLGLATCKMLLDELSARIEVHGPGLGYRTVSEEI